MIGLGVARSRATGSAIELCFDGAASPEKKLAAPRIELADRAGPMDN
jgi:hypothetical protein